MAVSVPKSSSTQIHLSARTPNPDWALGLQSQLEKTPHQGETEDFRRVPEPTTQLISLLKKEAVALLAKHRVSPSPERPCPDWTWEKSLPALPLSSMAWGGSCISAPPSPIHLTVVGQGGEGLTRLRRDS